MVGGSAETAGMGILRKFSHQRLVVSIGAGQRNWGTAGRRTGRSTWRKGDQDYAAAHLGRGCRSDEKRRKVRVQATEIAKGEYQDRAVLRAFSALQVASGA